MVTLRGKCKMCGTKFMRDASDKGFLTWDFCSWRCVNNMNVVVPLAHRAGRQEGLRFYNPKLDDLGWFTSRQLRDELERRQRRGEKS